jgi:hypothetical protein
MDRNLHKWVALVALVVLRSMQAHAGGNLTQPVTVNAGAGLTKSGQTLNVGAGTGITVGADTVSADTTYLQRRVSSSCAAGSAISAIAVDGSVTCDSDLVYIAGLGITISTNTISADTTYLQRRVSASCGVGSSIRAIAADGSVTCQTDSTGITNGAGANVVMKSDGTNAVASSITDDGTGVVTSESARVGYSTGTATALLSVGRDPALATNTQNGWQISTASDGNNYIDSKTYSGGSTFYRVGAGAQTGATTTWLTVNNGTGATTFADPMTLGSTLDLGTHQIHNVTDPTSGQDAATKIYVDTATTNEITGTLTSGKVPVASGAHTETDSSISDPGGGAPVSFAAGTTSTAGPNTFGETEYSFTTATNSSGTLTDKSFARARGVWWTITGALTLDGFGFSSGTPTDGQRFMICVIGGGSLTIPHENGGEGTAGRRLNLPQSGSIIVRSQQCRDFIYENAGGAGALRWRTEGVLTGSGNPSSGTVLMSNGNQEVTGSGINDSGTAVTIASENVTLNGTSGNFVVGGASSSGGHIGSKGVTPSLTSCGTSPTIDSRSTDTAGVVTLGTSAGTTCTVNFAHSYTTAPICTVSPNGTGPQVVVSVGSTTTSTLQISSGSDVSAKTVSYTCIGN